MKKFSEIDSFRHIVKNIQVKYGDDLPILAFIGTVKLHGSNLAIRRYNGKISIYSRNKEITVDKDNHNFAAWVKDSGDEIFLKIFNKISSVITDDVILYGEWIGPNINKGTAINLLPKRQWVLFAAAVNDRYVKLPKDLSAADFSIFNIYSAGEFNLDIDFNNLEVAINKLEEITLNVEKICPYGKLFDIEGTGEGLVWHLKEQPLNSRMWFKTKGEKHVKDVKRKHKDKKKIASASPEVVKLMKELLPELLPTWRLEQGINYLKDEKLEISMNNMGEYLKWVSKDILKEENDLIAANNFEWKDLSKLINSEARKVFISLVKATSS